MPDEPNWGAPQLPEDDPRQETNPFQTPQYRDTADPSEPAEQVPRSGPPWERDGASVQSFLATFQEVISAPKQCFGEMRQEGRIGSALAYGVGAMMLAMYVGLVVGFTFEYVKFAVFGVRGPLQDLVGLDPGMAIAMLALGFLCSLIIWPVMIVMMIVISACMIHIALAIAGGSDHGFEATLRVVSYSVGSTYIIGMIPIAGQFIYPVVFIVYGALGIAAAHEVSGRRATVAVLVPTVICYALMFGAGYLLGSLAPQPGANPLLVR